MRKTILITGATSGHGRFLAEQLSPQHTVLLHGRDRERTERLAADLGAEPFVADLGKIDVLINNAGIGYGTTRELSPQGHELRFAVMYLAPVLLTRLLLPRITSQVLNVGSLGQEPIDFDDITMERHYSGLTAYRRAKLALVMATFDLAMNEPELRANVVHPAGYMDTNMVRRGGGTPRSTVADGGRATLSVLASPLTGTFFDRDKPADAHEDAYRPELRARLRTISSAAFEAA
jgi:NAD(P)-dependent dehydrogenase (short-subunit alcohol dehydrogenase family)